FVDSGSHNDLTAEQDYLTFTYQLVQNAKVADIVTSCTVTNTITPDTSTFEQVSQNEVCNGPLSCIFRGMSVGPGSIGHVAAAISNCPSGCGGLFRVARIGLCAVATGQAVLHWQFSPPAPATRDTEIVDLNGDQVQNPTLFVDY